MTESKPWERQPGESIAAFNSFIQYRDMGGDRSLENVRQKNGKGTAYKRRIEAWSVKHRWVDRIIAYDDYLAQQATIARQEAEKKQANKWAERQAQHREDFWRLSQELRKRADDMLKFPLARVENITRQDDQGRVTHVTVVEPARWSFATLAQIVKTADDVGRLASELPTEVVDFVSMLMKKGLPLDKIFADLIENFKDVDVPGS